MMLGCAVLILFFSVRGILPIMYSSRYTIRCLLHTQTILFSFVLGFSSFLLLTCNGVVWADMRDPTALVVLFRMRTGVCVRYSFGLRVGKHSAMAWHYSRHLPHGTYSASTPPLNLFCLFLTSAFILLHIIRVVCMLYLFHLFVCCVLHSGTIRLRVLTTVLLATTFALLDPTTPLTRVAVILLNRAF